VTTVLLYALFAATAVVSLARPWVGVVAAYLMAVLTPQFIWPWIFEGTRPFFLVMVPTLIGFALAAARGEVRGTFLKTRINLFVAVWWVAVIVSYLFGPYVDVVSPYRFFVPSVTFDQANKTFLTYFVATLLIDEPRKARALFLVMAFSVAVLTWWANAQYLDGRVFGRLAGPAGIYRDENTFAMLFATGLPFLFYLGLASRSQVLRYALWAIVPFGWHAIFLTGSRGGLLAVAVSLCFMALRSKRKVLAGAMLPLFAVAFVLQGGLMRERAETIRTYKEDAAASSRLTAWPVIARMGLRYPLTGVGLSSVGAAFPAFSDTPPKVAHNTPIQILGEIGMIGFTAWTMMTVTAGMRLLRRQRKRRRVLAATGSGLNDYLLAEAVLAGAVGYLVSAMFLSLQFYESFLVLILLANFWSSEASPAEKERPATDKASEEKRAGVQSVGPG